MGRAQQTTAIEAVKRETGTRKAEDADGCSHRPIWPAGPHPHPVLALHRPRRPRARAEAPVRRPGVELPVPGDRAAQHRRLPHHLCRPHARGGGARRGRRALRLREPLRASRRADLPGRRRQREGLPVRLPLLALRSARQPALDRVRPRRERQGRHAGRLRHDQPRPAQAARHHVLRHGVRHAVA